MKWWKWVTGSEAKVLDHPLLGRITRESNAWVVGRIAPLGCGGNPSLSLAGDDSGPRPECVATYQRLRDDWNSIAPNVARDIFELNQNYSDGTRERSLRSPDQVWSGAELLAIDIHDEGTFALTYRFDWQDTADGHEVTIRFADWRPAGAAIDG
jgi:hypothetical protein